MMSMKFYSQRKPHRFSIFHIFRFKVISFVKEGNGTAQILKCSVLILIVYVCQTKKKSRNELSLKVFAQHRNCIYLCCKSTLYISIWYTYIMPPSNAVFFWVRLDMTLKINIIAFLDIIWI